MIDAIIVAWAVTAPLAVISAYNFGRTKGVETGSAIYKENYEQLAKDTYNRITELETNPTAVTKRSILALIAANTPHEHDDSFYLSFSFLMRKVDVDIELLRGFLHSMRADGLVEFGTAFSEDVIPVGGGYAITGAGRIYLSAREATS